jgi:hypothetical protein
MVAATVHVMAVPDLTFAVHRPAVSRRRRLIVVPMTMTVVAIVIVTTAVIVVVVSESGDRHREECQSGRAGEKTLHEPLVYPVGGVS